MPYPSLTAVGTGRIVDVAHLDRPAVLLCFAQSTQGEADPIEAAVRERYSASEVLVGHVVDLHTVPGMFRGVAERILQSEYEKAVAALTDNPPPLPRRERGPGGEVSQPPPSAQAAEDYVVILPDWDGSFVAAAGFAEDVSKRLGVIVFGADGTLLGATQGDEAAGACMALLAAD